jgi:WD40 repeat protein
VGGYTGLDAGPRIHVWSVRDGSLLAAFRERGALRSVAFSRDGKSLVTAESNAVKVSNAETGAITLDLSDGRAYSWDAELDRDGKRIVMGYGNVAQIRDAFSGALRTVLDGHSNFVTSASFSPDGALILTTSRDKTARVWDAATGAPLAVLRGHRGGVRSGTFAPDGNTVVTAGRDDIARVWDVHLEARPPAAIRALVEARIPYKLDGARLVPIAAP